MRGALPPGVGRGTRDDDGCDDGKASVGGEYGSESESIMGCAASASLPVRQSLDQARGQALLSHTALRFLNGIPDTPEFPPLLVQVEHRVRRVGVTVARLADAARIDDPAPDVEVERPVQRQSVRPLTSPI